MILIIDNNDERRNNLVIRLRVKGYLICGISYNDIEYYTKPYMTVYVNPPRHVIDNLKREETISVVCTERSNPSPNLPKWAIHISSAKSIENDIIEILDRSCSYMKNDQINVVGYACLKNGKFALGGKIIKITNMQLPILSLFLFNKNKKFKQYEACQYMHFKADAEESFARHVLNINKSLKDAGRDKIILKEGDLYYLNPEVANYVCKDYEIDEEDEKFFFRYKLIE